MSRNKRYNLNVPIKMQDGKTFWHQVGVAFLDEDKDQLTLLFNSLPLPDEEGKVRVMGFVPKEREEGAPATRATRTPSTARGASPAPRGSGRPAEPDDKEIPF